MFERKIKINRPLPQAVLTSTAFDVLFRFPGATLQAE
jgi:hypothetical protein